MASVVDIPWYANGFRGDKLEAALRDVAPTALRYGATAWAANETLEVIDSGRLGRADSRRSLAR